jgi:hypothetical protein
MTMVVIWPTGKTSDEIIGKAGNETRQVRTHTWKDLSIRVNPEATEEVMYHAGRWVDQGLHIRLHMCKVIHSSFKSSDSFNRALSLINPITNVPLQRSIPIRVPSRGGGSGSEVRLEVTLWGVITTTLMITRVATPIPSVPLRLFRVSLRCSRGLLCCLHASSLVSARWSCEAVVRLSHLIKL